MLLTELPPSDSSDERGQRGERNREEHRHRGAHASQKHQDHDRGQEQADGAFVQQRFDGRLDEHRLIEHHLGDQALGHVEQMLERFA